MFKHIIYKSRLNLEKKKVNILNSILEKKKIIILFKHISSSKTISILYNNLVYQSCIKEDTTTLNRTWSCEYQLYRDISIDKSIVGFAGPK